MGKLIEACVPDIGDYRDVPVIEILVGPGDRVEANTTVVVLESDKATLDVPAGHGGLVEEVLVRAGDLVSQGSPVLRVRNSIAAAVLTDLAPTQPETAETSPARQPDAAEKHSARLSPLRLRRWVRAVPLSGVWRESSVSISGG